MIKVGSKVRVGNCYFAIGVGYNPKLGSTATVREINLRVRDLDSPVECDILIEQDGKFAYIPSNSLEEIETINICGTSVEVTPATKTKIREYLESEIMVSNIIIIGLERYDVSSAVLNNVRRML